MHTHIINAAVQLLPLAQDRHPYAWVDEAIAIIQQSGIKYEINAFATVLEGTYDEIMEVINKVNNHLQTEGCHEWILNLQLQIRSNGDITADEKVEKYRNG